MCRAGIRWGFGNDSESRSQGRILFENALEFMLRFLPDLDCGLHKAGKKAPDWRRGLFRTASAASIHTAVC